VVLDILQLDHGHRRNRLVAPGDGHKAIKHVTSGDQLI
jgi:hypothetical protein